MAAVFWQLAAKDVDIFAATCPADGRNRILPIVTLGRGHFGSVDMAKASLAKVAPEQDSTVRRLRAWAAKVRCTMPDEDTTRLVNDFPDVIEAYINGDAGEDIVGVDESLFCCRAHSGSTS